MFMPWPRTSINEDDRLQYLKHLAFNLELIFCALAARLSSIRIYLSPLGDSWRNATRNKSPNAAMLGLDEESELTLTLYTQTSRAHDKGHAMLVSI